MPNVYYDATNVAVDAAISFVFLFGAGFTAERWLRSRRRFQMRVTSLFSAIWVIAVLIMIGKWELKHFNDGYPLASEFSFLLMKGPWYVRIPLMVTLAVALHWTGGRLACLAGWCFSFVSRRFLRSSTGGST